MRCTACDWAACRLVCRMSGRVPVQPLAHLRVRTFESPTKSTFDVCNTQHLVLSSRILRALFQQFVHLRVRTLHPRCLRKSPSEQESIHFLTCSLNSNSHQGTRLSTSVGLLLVHKGIDIPFKESLILIECCLAAEFLQSQVGDNGQKKTTLGA